MRAIIYIISVFALLSCKNDVNQFSPTPYPLHIPANYPDMIVNAQNPLTLEGVQLGRKLYYDAKLHPTQSMSCASCHNQQTSFSTASSNSLPHINLGFYNKFLWNGKIEGTLEDVMLFEVEEFFGTDFNLLKTDEEYESLYFKAFGSTEITATKTAYALAQFLRTINAFNSKFDQYQQGLATLTADELEGYNIFYSERGDCFHCHGGALFTDNDFHNNGLDYNPTGGRYTVTNNPNDIGKYKTPTLKNIELTAPYMHDGRFQTLEEVVEFYSTGIEWSPTVDPLMIPGAYLEEQEKQQLVAFLKTLTDYTLTTNENLSDPN